MGFQIYEILDIALWSVVITIWIILSFLYCVNKKFRDPPGSLIAWEIVAEMINCICFIYYKMKGTEQGLSIQDCTALGVILAYSSSLMWLYQTCLCIEIYRITKFPIDNMYSKRANIYHILNHSQAIVVGIMVLIFHPQPGSKTYWDISDYLELYVLILEIIQTILAIFSLVLIVLTIKRIQTGQRYLYRYIIFCLILLWINISNLLVIYFGENVVSDTFDAAILVFATTWRLLEITVLHNYFNSLKQNHDIRSTSYIPLNQAFFQANMISGVKVVLSYLSRLFESLDIEEDQNSKFELQSTDLFENMKVKKYKTWTFDRLQAILNPSTVSQWEEGIQIKEYEPSIFKEIRHLNHVSHIYLRDLFLSELNDQIDSNMFNTGGRSGSFFYFTSDNRFIIKSITKDERQVLLGRFLKEYFSKIHDSLLAQIYGVYEITLEDQEPFSFMLMGNIATPELEVVVTFDIKGSKVNRCVAESSCGTLESLGSYRVYKDQDFENYVGSISPYSSRILINKLKSDVQFLEELGIMDYSLLLKICQPISGSNQFLFHGEEYSYWLGIIDFLQQFTCQKQAEVKLKSIFNNKEQISCQNPQKYAARFLNKIQDYIKVFTQSFYKIFQIVYVNKKLVNGSRLDRLWDFGQVYVALSRRANSLESIWIKGHVIRRKMLKHILKSKNFMIAK